MNILITEWLNGLLYASAVFDWIVYSFAEYGLFIVVIIFVYLSYKYKSSKFFTLGISTAVVAWFISQCINVITLIDRPFIALNSTVPLFTHGLNDSFPSGHATIMFVLVLFAYKMTLSNVENYTKILKFNFVIAVMSSIARVIAGVHWATDVLGSVVLAYVVVSIVHYLFFEKRKNFKKYNNKRKILFAITKASWGGAQRYVYDLAKNLKEEFDVVVVCGRNEFGNKNIFSEKLSNEGIRIIEIKQLGRDISFINDIKSFFVFIKHLKNERPDIVHLNSSKMAGVGAVAVFLCNTFSFNMANINIIYTTHGLPFLEKRSFLENLFVKIITLVTVVLSSNIICVSKRDYDELAKYRIIKNKIHLVYNGVEDMNFLTKSDARELLIKQYPSLLSRRGCKWICSISELRINKNVESILDMLSKLDEDFIYIHFGTGELLQELEQKTKKLGLHNSVFWYGFVKDAHKYLKAFDLFVLYSIQEGLPYVLVEAKLAGLAVEASDAGGIPEILEMSKSEIEREFSIKNMLEKTKLIYMSNV